MFFFGETIFVFCYRYRKKEKKKMDIQNSERRVCDMDKDNTNLKRVIFVLRTGRHVLLMVRTDLVVYKSHSNAIQIKISV